MKISLVWLIWNLGNTQEEFVVIKTSQIIENTNFLEVLVQLIVLSKTEFYKNGLNYLLHETALRNFQRYNYFYCNLRFKNFNSTRRNLANNEILLNFLRIQ